MTIGTRYKFAGTRIAVETARGSSKLITGISKANPAVVTSTAHGFVTGDTVYVDAVGMPELTAGEYVVASLSSNTFSLIGVDSTGYTTFAVNSPNTNVAQKITFSDFCELTGYNQQDGTSSPIDATTVCSTAKEFEVDLPDSGSLSLDFNAAPGTPVQVALRAARKAGSVVSFLVVFPKSGGSVVMFGIVQSTTLAGSNGGLHKATASIKLTGDVVVLNAAGVVI